MKFLIKLYKKTVRKFIRMFGLDIVQFCPEEFDQPNNKIIQAVEPYTMTSRERLNALVDAVRYVVVNDIKGALVECGVWKGGSTMAMALTLNEQDNPDRELYLYDTFSGMTSPTDLDVSHSGSKAKDVFTKTSNAEDASDWCACSIDEVKGNLSSTGYPQEKLHFIEGKVEDTIPKNLPESIAILRLDTDWYESTKHELEYLFPLLSPKGVIIIDDYGYWKGARKAVDEYIAEKDICILLNRIDFTGRIGIKVK